MSKRRNPPKPKKTRDSEPAPGLELVEEPAGVEVLEEPSFADRPADDSPWSPTKLALLRILDGLASLRLTVALFAMAIFIVLAGTLGQVHRDIWDVVHDYFRMSPEGSMAVHWTIPVIDKEVIIPSPATFVDLKIFFPPAFSSDGQPPDLSKPASPARLLSSLVLGFGWAALVWLIPLRDRKIQLAIYASLGILLAFATATFGGFLFPKGWTIGAVMAVNLLAAHLMRFKIQSSGTRLWAGAGVIALGILTTYGVIKSGSNKEGVLKENWLLGYEFEWSQIWILFEMLLAVLVALGGYACVSMLFKELSRDKSDAKRSSYLSMVVVSGLGTLAVAGVLAFLILGGDDVRLNDSGMRILWQLLKATVAGLILLGGCAMVFRKRAGVVVLHAGVALLMLSELLVGVSAVEGQMTIMEGESSNYVQDIRSIELAVIDSSGSQDKVVAIPGRLIKKGNLIEDDRLPVNIRVGEFYENSTLEKPKKSESNPADSGYGRSEIAKPVQGSTGTDSASDVDLASAYVTLRTKDGDKTLGTWLVSQLRTAEQPFEVDGKTYAIALRFKRTYKPYTITLKDAVRENYVGTSTPRDYRSIIDLNDPSRNEDRKDVHIWMNNPLRYGGETFYQSGLQTLRPGLDVTVLQVVTNDGWMIPYVSCMIVAVGMLAHFLMGLTRFLNRSAQQRGGRRRLMMSKRKTPNSNARIPCGPNIGRPRLRCSSIPSKSRPGTAGSRRCSRPC